MLKRILVCDDDDGIREIISIILEESGYSVKTITNGKGIQKKIKDYSPDLILLDIWMPGIDGKEVTKILKKDKKTSSIPIIVISALAETRKIAKQIGADGYIAKPFNLKDLTSIVKKHTI